MSTEAALLPVFGGPTDNAPVSRPLQPLAVLRRRRFPMLVALISAIVVAMIVAAVWPPTYVSSATVLIEQQEMPLDLVRSTISSYADQRLQVINQRVMTSENLLRIIGRYNLYPRERTKRGREIIVEMMRNDMMFRTISADVIDPRQGRPIQATIAFTVGYKGKSAESAAQVATELSSLYLEENLRSRRRLTEETTQFLTDEAGKLSRKIKDLDDQIAHFKEENANTIPERDALNVTQLNRADDEKREIELRLTSIAQNLVYIESQLAQVDPTSQLFDTTGERVLTTADRLKLVRNQYERASSIYAPDHPDVQRLKRELEGLEKTAGISAADAANDRARRLEQAEAELAGAKERYAPDHPDVVRLERLVAGLREAQLVTPPAASEVTPDNPTYINLMTQKEQLLTDRRSQEARRAELITRTAELERRLEASPAVERRYYTLARELESTQAKYREVQQKQMEAQLAESLELERKGERFTLIEPAVPPQEPTSPNRVLILVMGIVLALGASIGIAALMEGLDGSVRGRADVMSLLTAPPLAVVPWFENVEDRKARRRRLIYTIAVAIGFLAIVVAFVHFFFRPLDVLWAIAMQRLGI